METSLPLIGMMLAVTSLATNMIISKIAMSNGTSNFILSVYSNALATLILFPCAFLFHRSNRPPLTSPILCRIFLLAIFGCLADIGCYAGIKNSSPTLGTELLNLVHLHARHHFQDEKIQFEKIKRLVEVSWYYYFDDRGIHRDSLQRACNRKQGTDSKFLCTSFTIPTKLGARRSLAHGRFFLDCIMASILKIYPSEMIIVAVYCLFVTMQSTIVALIAEKDVMAWKLQAEMGLFAVLYAGIINITFRLYMMSWCLSRTGPLFVSLFNPLTIVISVVIGVIFFHEVLYLGSVVGAVILVTGFYAVIWGKAEESKLGKLDEFTNVESRSQEVPLLQDRVEED